MQIARDSIRAIGARAASILASFAQTLVVARLLGAEDAGWFFLVTTSVTILATFGRFGSDLIALRVCGGDTDDLRGDLRSAALLSGAACVAACGVVGVALGALRFEIPGVAPAVVLLSVSALAPQAFAVFSGAILRGRGRLAVGVLAELGSIPLLTLVLLGGLLAVGHVSLEAVLICSAIASWATLLWSAPMALHSLSGERAPARRTSFRAFLRRRFLPASSMMGASLLFLLSAWLPVYILSAVSGLEAVSFYTLAARLGNLMALVPSIQVSYLAPAFARLFHRGDLDDLNALCNRSVRQAVVVLALPAVILTIGAPFLVVLLYGDAFAPAATPLAILAAGVFLVTLLGQVNQLTLLCGLEHAVLALNVVLVVGWLTVGTWAAHTGAAGGTAVFSAASGIVYAAACALLLRRKGVLSYLRLRGRPAP